MIFPIKSNRACKSEVAFCVPGRFKTSQSGRIKTATLWRGIYNRFMG